mgnify:FL=1
MKRIAIAYLKAKEVLLKEHKKYEYKYLLPTSILLFVVGLLLSEGVLRDILIILAIIGSPVVIILTAFWSFIIYLIKPN